MMTLMAMFKMITKPLHNTNDNNSSQYSKEKDVASLNVSKLAYR